MIIETLIGFAFVAALVTFLVPDEVAGRVGAALSLVPLVGTLWMWSQFDGSGNALMGGTLAFETQFDLLTLSGY